jgi:hypothetical protein
MDDRQLLEAAARAAGIKLADEIDSHIPSGGLWVVGRGGRDAVWDPLRDDADALRLAVMIGMTIKIEGHECEVFDIETGECLSSVPIMGASCFVNPAEATNPYAATRRAIVRAAAALQESRDV